MSNDTAQQEQPQVQLQLEDLIRALEIINLASTRGAFKPDEFTSIGVVYDRIFAFLLASGAIQQPQQTGAQPEGNQS